MLWLFDCYGAWLVVYFGFGLVLLLLVPCCRLFILCCWLGILDLGLLVDCYVAVVSWLLVLLRCGWFLPFEVGWFELLV